MTQTREVKGFTPASSGCGSRILILLFLDKSLVGTVGMRRPAVALSQRTGEAELGPWALLGHNIRATPTFDWMDVYSGKHGMPPQT